MGLVWDRAFEITIGQEGNLSLDAQDRGNWTSGIIGQGLLKGSKFGLSAAQYPNVDFTTLTVDWAKNIYLRDYWLPTGCDKVPGALAVLLFDTAVNGGQPVKWLQAVVGTKQDGIIGPKTQAAIESHRCNGWKILADFQATRLRYLASLPVWTHNQGGWSKRLMEVLLLALTVPEKDNG